MAEERQVLRIHRRARHLAVALLEDLPRTVERAGRQELVAAGTFSRC